MPNTPEKKLDPLDQHVAQMNAEWEKWSKEQRRDHYVDAARLVCKRCRNNEPVTIIASDAFAHRFNNTLGAKRFSRCAASALVAEITRLEREIRSS